MDSSWIYHGFIMDLSCIYHAFIMDLSWINHGFIMDLSWIYHGSVPNSRERDKEEEFVNVTVIRTSYQEGQLLT